MKYPSILENTVYPVIFVISFTMQNIHYTEILSGIVFVFREFQITKNDTNQKS